MDLLLPLEQSCSSCLSLPPYSHHCNYHPATHAVYHQYRHLVTHHHQWTLRHHLVRLKMGTIMLIVNHNSDCDVRCSLWCFCDNAVKFDILMPLMYLLLLQPFIWITALLYSLCLDAGPPSPAAHLRDVFYRMGLNDKVYTPYLMLRALFICQ